MMRTFNSAPDKSNAEKSTKPAAKKRGEKAPAKKQEIERWRHKKHVTNNRLGSYLAVKRS